MKSRHEIYKEFYDPPPRERSHNLDDGGRVVDVPSAVVATNDYEGNTVEKSQNKNDNDDFDDECFDGEIDEGSDNAGDEKIVRLQQRRRRRSKSKTQVGIGRKILLIENRRLMQLYFAKKILQLDMLVDVHASVATAVQALSNDDDLYSLVFCSYDLLDHSSLGMNIHISVCIYIYIYIYIYFCMYVCECVCA